MPKEKNYTIYSFCIIPGKEKEYDAAKSWEGKKQYVMSMDKYFENYKSREQWLSERMEDVALNVYGVKATVRVFAEPPQA